MAGLKIEIKEPDKDKDSLRIKDREVGLHSSQVAIVLTIKVGPEEKLAVNMLSSRHYPGLILVKAPEHWPHLIKLEVFILSSKLSQGCLQDKAR